MNQVPNEAIRLLRDVDANMVPSGDEVKFLFDCIESVFWAPSRTMVRPLKTPEE